MTRRLSSRRGWLIAAASLALLTLALPFLLPAQTARGKFAAPLPTESSPARAQAQRLALADGRVLARLAGHPGEVLAVLPVGGEYTAASLACALSPCQLVEIYDAQADATVSAIVDVPAGLVRDVLYQPHVHPGPSQGQMDLASEIARSSPEFIRELGRAPSAAELTAMPSGVPGSACDSGHICLAVTAPQGRSLVWAVVDVTAGKLVAVLRTAIPAETARLAAPPERPAGCPSGGSVARNGWSLSYETTETNGFRVANVTYLGVPVLTSAKIVEWHVDYGTTGFVDSTGCNSLIFPSGPTQVNDLLSGSTVVGFEVVQDFRMPSWGSICNYRYDQHDQFYNDGRFRIVGRAFGQGCASNGIYRPIMRLDFGLGGPGGDSFDTWDGAAWQTQPVEGWWAQSAPYTAEGYQWRLTDAGGRALFIEPGQGQFGDGGRGDFAFIYATQHHAAEGDTDLGDIGTCCNSDYQQGPEQFINGESIVGQDVVLWYVPQMQADATPGSYYCWTVSVSETYPCPAGPMFVPKTLAAGFVDSAPQPPGATVAFTSTSGGLGPLAYEWNFGDGRSSSLAQPAHAYAAGGSYTVTLTITDTTGSQSAAEALFIGERPRASFQGALSGTISNTVVLTNTSTGTAPLSYLWDFGDALTSTAVSPSHTYAHPGVYTIALQATNRAGSDSDSGPAFVPPVRSYWPIVLK